METLEYLQKKIKGARELHSVVRTMKAMAATKIGQYETAIKSLEDYYYSVALGMVAYFKQVENNTTQHAEKPKSADQENICAIVIGSEQGLVGQFNETISEYAVQILDNMPGKKEIWAVGERIPGLMSDAGYETSKIFPVPITVKAITPLVNQILFQSEEILGMEGDREFYIFHNRITEVASNTPVVQRWLPLDDKWKSTVREKQWPTKNLPRVVGEPKATFSALINELLFISIFKTFAESLTCESTIRLRAMQRAEKNIKEITNDLIQVYNKVRQKSIDEELFDVVSGFEALRK